MGGHAVAFLFWSDVCLCLCSSDGWRCTNHPLVGECWRPVLILSGGGIYIDYVPLVVECVVTFSRGRGGMHANWWEDNILLVFEYGSDPCSI